MELECSLIVICFLLKGHLCHNLNACFLLFICLFISIYFLPLIYSVINHLKLPLLLTSPAGVTYRMFWSGWVKESFSGNNSGFQLSELGLLSAWPLTSAWRGEGRASPPPALYTSWNRCFSSLSTLQRAWLVFTLLSTFNSCIVWKHTATDDLQLCF